MEILVEREHMLHAISSSSLRRGFALAAALFVSGALLAPRAAAQSTNNRNNLLLVQQDHVLAFNFATGAGRQVGTVTGRISGTSVVDFQFTLTSATTLTFDNKVVITDLDGDQLRIRNVGTGRFIFPIDPSVFGLGGPLEGSYEVLAGTGKFASWVGRKYPYRAVASNPAGGLGTVYVEVYSNPI
jgi:hypothetical protein